MRFLLLIFVVASCVHEPKVATNTYSYNGSHAACTRPIKNGINLPENFAMKFKSEQQEVDVGDLWDAKNTRPNAYCFRKFCNKEGKNCHEMGIKELRSSIKVKRKGTKFQMFKSKVDIAANQAKCDRGNLKACARSFLDLAPDERKSVRGQALQKKFCSHSMFYCFPDGKKPDPATAQKVKGWNTESSVSSQNGVMHEFRYFVDPKYELQWQSKAK